MDCPRCNIAMVAGKVLAPVYGNANGNLGFGVTIYPVAATLTDCRKCPSCGHSQVSEVRTTAGDVIRW